jgi:hypothetical protein
MIMDHDLFMWIVPTGMTMGLSVGWLIYDLYRLRKFWPDRKERHDEVFGSYIGISIALMGIIGTLRFHL